MYSSNAFVYMVPCNDVGLHSGCIPVESEITESG